MNRQVRSMGLSLAITGLCLARTAGATTFVLIGDVSQVQYQAASDGRVYLRNLNSLSAYPLWCCYNYWIDPTTVEGKNIWTMYLVAASQGTPLYLGLPDGSAAGLITYAGKL